MVGTWAPRGQTPVLRTKLTRDHLSAAAALTPDGKLYLQIQRDPFDGPSILRFLKRPLRQIPGKLTVIWDGLPAHRSQLVRSFLADGAADRVHLERLPGYAPELNPVELIWAHLKRVELRNACFPGLGWLEDGVIRAVKRLRHKAHMLQDFIRHAGYTFTSLDGSQ